MTIFDCLDIPNLFQLLRQSLRMNHLKAKAINSEPAIPFHFLLFYFLKLILNLKFYAFHVNYKIFLMFSGL
jgi:hypothetical protein